MSVKSVIFVAIVATMPAMAAESPVPQDQAAKYWHAVAANQTAKADFFAGLTSVQKKQMEDMQASSQAIQSIRSEICKGELSSKDGSPNLTCITPEPKK